MTQDEIIVLARMAKLPVQHPDWIEGYERFATLVAAAEREVCAKVCDAFEVPSQIKGAHPDYLVGKEMAASQLAAAIRARGNT